MKANGRFNGLADPLCDLPKVEGELLRRVRSGDPHLEKMARYTLQAGGKRLRPALALLAYRAVGGDDVDSLLPLAAAYELVHSATLIHDDINDGAPVRRGRPTLAQEFGPASAIVAGDYLFVKGYEVCGRYGEEIIRVTAEACTALAEGQILELRNVRNLDMGERTYHRIIARKTAAPLAAGARAGAILGGGTPRQVEGLAAYGHHLGMAFQITDDLLDVAGDPDALGKPVGQDLAHGVLTLPILYGLRHGSAGDRRLIRKALAGPPTPAAQQAGLAAVRRSGGVEHSRLAARRHARAAIEVLPPGLRYREHLEKMVDSIVTRLK
ncbi:MAG: polyprenyl synthetase family protein [Halobacteria archaeon]